MTKLDTINRYFKQSILLLICIILTGISCSKKDFVRRGDTLPEAFRKSMKHFTEKDYDEAIRGFEIVIDLGRGTDFAQEAQFYLAESHFNDRSYLLAASEYQRYASLYPNSERREEAFFKEALCYYKLSPRYKLDQKHTHKALEKFNLFESRYPESDRIPEIAEYETELRAKLARKLYSAAELYMRTDQYEAAALYYGLTIDRYPEAEKWAELALVNQIEAYVVYARNSVRSKQRERYQKAVDSYEKYLQLFPHGEHRSLADQYVDQARVALAELQESDRPISGNDSTNQR